MLQVKLIISLYIFISMGIVEGLWNTIMKDCRGQCKQGEGDCDKDRDCFPGLICDYDSWFAKDYCKAGPKTRNGYMSKWSSWSECSEICGKTGTKSRTRKCIKPKYGGFPCPKYKTKQTKKCFPGDCHVDGGWGEWSDWESCSLSCGQGLQSRYRKCDSPAPNPGADNIWHDCERDGSSAIETRTCNKHPCPIHCEWDDWVTGECSQTCGTGTRTNTRKKLRVEEHGGTCIGQPTEIETCNPQECPVHCEWDEWKIGECDKSCGGGFRTNTRTVKVDSKHGGEECAGSSTIMESCNVQECPVDCVWGEWNVGECSKECGGGHQISNRQKIQEELFGGKPCEGEARLEEECNIQECPDGCVPTTSSNPTPSTCKCINFVTAAGDGKCLTSSPAPNHCEMKFCYVAPGNTCLDAEKSTTIRGLSYSAQACL